MSAIPKTFMTESEYLAFELESEFKHEYFNGEIFAMTGASEPHNTISSNINASFHGQFRGRPCKIYSSDMRVFIPKTGLYTYPDLVIVCGKPEFVAGILDTLLNPIILIEILSPSTEAYDRGQKFQHYRTIPSLREYLLVSQYAPRIEHFLWTEQHGWNLLDAIGLNSKLTLPSIDCTLELTDVYDKVDFDLEDSG